MITTSSKTKETSVKTSNNELNDEVTQEQDLPPEKGVDRALRPQSFDDYIGQDKMKKNLQIFIEAAKKRDESIDHVIFYGPAGLGKTTIANIIAKEMGVAIKTTSGPAIERVGDLGSILTNLQDGDILFIDEIHRLNKSVEEILYPAMEDHKLDIVVGKGPSAHTLQLDLPQFTLVGATTKLGALSNPLRDRFGAIHRLEFYEQDDITEILKRSAILLDCSLETSGAQELSRAARQTPRVANRLLKRARDFADVHNKGSIDSAVAREALALLDIDDLGLEPTDRKIIEALIDKFNGGPVGLHTLAMATSEEMQTIEDVYEPYLVQLGLLLRSPRGRIATDRAYEHLGRPKNSPAKKLFV